MENDDGENGNEKESQDQAYQVDWALEPSSPSLESAFDSIPASFLNFETEPPDALSPRAREATGLGPGGTPQSFSWSSTTLYGSILGNPWLDNEPEG